MRPKWTLSTNSVTSHGRGDVKLEVVRQPSGIRRRDNGDVKSVETKNLLEDVQVAEDMNVSCSVGQYGAQPKDEAEGVTKSLPG